VFEFRNNTVDNVNSDPASIGIFNYMGGGVIDGNHVSNANDAIASNWSTGTIVSNNTITNSGSGVHVDNSAAAANDEIHHNHIDCGATNGYGIFTFGPYGDVSVHDNDIAACAVGLGAFGRQPVAVPVRRRRSRTTK
jgi:nitrous oxidase accessory protein NosD